MHGGVLRYFSLMAALGAGVCALAAFVLQGSDSLLQKSHLTRGTHCCRQGGPGNPQSRQESIEALRCWSLAGRRC